MNKRTFISVLLLLTIVGLLVYIVFSPEEKKENINLRDTKEEVLNEVNASKQYIQKTTQWMGDKAGADSEDVADFNPPIQKGANNDPKKSVVNYFVAGLLTKDVDIFMSSFYVQTISEDLFKKSVTDKTVVVKEIMNRISRNGQLNGVQYVDKKGALNSETDKFSLILTYKDHKQAKITLQVKSVADEHSSHKNQEQTLVITTHTWDIIKQIEAQI